MAMEGGCDGNVLRCGAGERHEQPCYRHCSINTRTALQYALHPVHKCFLFSIIPIIIQ